MKPLNGSKTHPLSEMAIALLKRLVGGPIPRQEINPGLANRLLRESLVSIVSLPSPYKTRKGMVEHFQITDAGKRWT